MYVFLFGRDFKLSFLEVLFYFKQKNISYTIVTTSDTHAIFNFKQKLNFKEVINDLGGTTRIYKVFYSSEKINSSFLDKFDVNFSKKFNYSISHINISSNQLQAIIESFKEFFKKERVKAVYKKPKKFKDKKENPIVNPNNYFSYSLDKGFELFVSKNDSLYYFATAIECYNPKDLILKDTLRPEKENLYSTSFRLTKIMINLLALKKGKRILDPFCGFGNFLIDGLSKGYDVVGIDKDREMVLKSKKNLLWATNYFKFKNNYTILHGDSSKLKFSADAVVFEPYMGPFISKLPNYNRARDIIDSLNKLYYDLFKNLYNNLKPNTKVVCILPELKTYDGKLLNISESVFLKNNFDYFNFLKLDKNINFKNPIFYTAPSDSKINRYIYILERK